MKNRSLRLALLMALWSVAFVSRVHSDAQEVSSAVGRGAQVIGMLEEVGQDMADITDMYQQSAARIEQRVQAMRDTPDERERALSGIIDELIDDIMEPAKILHRIGTEVIAQVDEQRAATFEPIMEHVMRIAESMRTVVSSIKMSVPLQRPASQQATPWFGVPASSVPVQRPTLRAVVPMSTPGPYDYPY